MVVEAEVTLFGSPADGERRQKSGTSILPGACVLCSSVRQNFAPQAEGAQLLQPRLWLSLAEIVRLGLGLCDVALCLLIHLRRG